jgi:hypothetical protein
VQTVAATPPSERFLLVTCRFTPRGVDDIRAWVERSLGEFRDRPVDAAIQQFRSARLDDHLVLMTLYAYADIPVGEAYDTVFGLADAGGADGALARLHLLGTESAV